jgi:hypothetical protein
VGGWLLKSICIEEPVNGLTMNMWDAAGFTGSSICFE